MNGFVWSIFPSHQMRNADRCAFTSAAIRTATAASISEVDNLFLGSIFFRHRIGPTIQAMAMNARPIRPAR